MRQVCIAVLYLLGELLYLNESVLVSLIDPQSNHLFLRSRPR